MYLELTNPIHPAFLVTPMLQFGACPYKDNTWKILTRKAASFAIHPNPNVYNIWKSIAKMDTYPWTFSYTPGFIP